MFYYHKNGKFLYSSDIKTLLTDPAVRPQIDTNGIAELILLGPGRTPDRTVFKDIKQLPPATRGHYDPATDKLVLQKYWSLTDKEHTDTFEQTKEKVRELVVGSIERMLTSESRPTPTPDTALRAQGNSILTSQANIPLRGRGRGGATFKNATICTFLSGGLDSSIISAIAQQYLAKQGKKLETFSVDYVDNEKHFSSSKFQPNSDNAYIEEMSAFLGAKHHRILLDTDDLIDALYEAVDARGFPGMADIDVSLLLFCRKVKEEYGIDMALSGEGADEIFGGYPWFRDETIRNKQGFPWSGSVEFRRSFLKDEFADAIDCNYVQKRYQSAIADTHILPSASPLERRMKEMTNLNLTWFGQTLLERKYCMSTTAGLTVGLPFCDHRLVEYLYTVPWEFKDYKGREKGLLREAMAGLLPDTVLWRKKSPYPKTHNPAYLKAVSERMRDVISGPNAPLLQIVKKDALENLLKIQNPTPWYGQLMTTPQTIAYFLQINYWLEKYKVEIV